MIDHECFKREAYMLLRESLLKKSSYFAIEIIIVYTYVKLS